jgi:hypothetical protein
MSILEFVLWILHIIFSIISIVTIIAVGYDQYIVDWFEAWVEKNKISPFVEKLVLIIGTISPGIAIVTGMILETIVVK